jgi:Protein of unknown function (DUF779)
VKRSGAAQQANAGLVIRASRTWVRGALFRIDLDGSRMTDTPIETVAQVVATDAALALIKELQGRYGDLMFHQSGGCCDGSAPMCFPRGEFLVGDQDVLLGDIGGHPSTSAPRNSTTGATPT